MRVRAAVNRGIAKHMVNLQKQRPADAASPPFVESFRGDEHENRPQPGQDASRDLETRLPVDAVPPGVLADPRLHLRDGLARKTLVSGQDVGFRQPRQVLMTIQFVNDLWVRAGIVGEVIIGPELSRPSISRYRIPMPIDVLTQTDSRIT